MRRPRRQCGLSLVEMLVGMAVGLIVAAAGASVLAAHGRESRVLQSEARLMQDLRAAAELVARDLRRAGHWAGAASGVRSDGGASPVASPHGVVAAAGAASDAVRLSFSRNGSESSVVDDDERFGFRLRNGAVELQLGAGNWQALSDTGSLVVTELRIEPRLDEISLAAWCERECDAGSVVCPPRQQVRSFAVTLAARSTADA
ncbi:MAG: prepilin-type N-terminal cleavage/methylation domain-containing protein, partial [Caldimonas sp.]